MLNTRGLLGCLVALVTACGDSGGGSTETGASTTGMTGTDAGPTEGTTATPGTDTGETGGTTAATEEPTGGTTGPVNDPETLQACNDFFAANDALMAAQCTCLVEIGDFPSQKDCLDAAEPPLASNACVCEVYSGFPGTKEALECRRQALEAGVACAEGVMCTDSVTPLIECLDKYNQQLFACAEVPLAAEAAKLIECENQPPFMCGSGETIPQVWKCDTEAECMDQTDESTCPDTFMCKDGSGWFPNSFKCDTFEDCKDGEDEAGCPTFMCMSGQIILETQKCNGFADCRDESDEGDAAMCPTFMCTSGETIPLVYKCDDLADCADGSDEVGCP